MVLLVAMYVGAISGGLITATLLRMPGTPAAVMTTFDGYPMARGGRPGRALGIGITASFVGGILSPLSHLSHAHKTPVDPGRRSFGPFHYFTLIMMAMVLIASVSEGLDRQGPDRRASGHAGLHAGGRSRAAGQPRLTFDWYMLNGGLKLLPVLIGTFAVSQIIADALQIRVRMDTGGDVPQGDHHAAAGVSLAIR